MRVAVTGSSGQVGTMLVPRLMDHFDLKLIDIAPPTTDAPEHLKIDICDTEALTAAFEGVDAVVHLAGQRAVSASWAELEQPNIVGLVSTFEAAHRAGVGKIVFASTNHVTGMYDQEQAWPLSAELPVRPDSLYGVTKAFGEALGRYYSDKFAMSVACLRFGWVLERPHNEQARWQWLSPDDLARLVSGALVSDVRFGIYYGVSNNAQRRWSIENARLDLDYVPADDSEQYFVAISGAPADRLQPPTASA
jgi:NAD+ dependent glucose-6-phosphate dehydrogenase